MSQVVYPAGPLVEKASVRSRQFSGGLRFDLVCVVLLGWLITGACTDAFAHSHNIVENFWTPWHGILYTGGLAVLSFVAATLLGNRWRGYSWRNSIPVGYEYSVVGLLLFPLGGVGDMLWHTTLGIERGVEGVLSPTHLLLMVAVFLMFSGPIRASWLRSASRKIGYVEAMPVVLATTYILLLAGLATLVMHPFGFIKTAQLQAADITEGIMGGFLVEATIISGVILSILRRWQLPFGSLTLILGVIETTILLIQPHSDSGWNILFPVGWLAGLACDVLLWKLRPRLSETGKWRLLAFFIPAVLYSLYFAGLFITETVNWRIHAWGGLIFAGGAVGLLMSFLLFPPRLPQAIQD